MTMTLPAHHDEAAAGGTGIGETLGVEEEFHVVDATTFTLRDCPPLASYDVPGTLGVQLHNEIASTQLEVATGVCHTLDEVRAEIVAARRGAVNAVSAAGATILPASTHPQALWSEQRLTPQVRYIEMYERWGLLALQQVIAGCHVHVGVPDLDTAVAVMDRARPYLPTLLALTGSSPFHEGIDTGYASYRTQWFSRWPTAGAPEQLGDAATYRSVVAALVRADVIEDASHLYWDMRPSLRHPTLEFRMSDVCTSVDDAVLVAGLLRALTVTLAARAAEGVPSPDVRPEILRAARWRAARYGIEDHLIEPVSGDLVPARFLVEQLMSELEPELDRRGELETACALVKGVFERGTSAMRQREVLHRTADPLMVARWVVGAGLLDC